MFGSLNSHRSLFLWLFCTPLIFHSIIAQLSILTLASRHYSPWLVFLPVRACLALQGLLWGGAGGLISVAFALGLFLLLPKWTALKTHPVWYALCWLVPFCLAGLFGSAMAAGAPGATPSLTPEQSLIAGIWGQLLIGLPGGIIGLIVFSAVHYEPKS